VTSVAQEITEPGPKLLEQYNEKMAETANTEDFHHLRCLERKVSRRPAFEVQGNHSLREVCGLHPPANLRFSRTAAYFEPLD